MQAALRLVDHAHRVLHRHQLPPRGLDIHLRAPERGEDERRAPGDEVRAVELGGDLDRQLGGAERARGQLGVRRRGEEVAAHREEHLGPGPRPWRGCFSTTSSPRARGGSKPKVAFYPVEERRRRPLGDAHRAVSLDVAVPADRAGPGAGLPDAPRSSRKFTISWMLSTAFRCWVSPIAQEKVDPLVRGDWELGQPRASPRGRFRLPATRASQGAARTWPSPRPSNPSGWRPMKSRASNLPGRDRHLQQHLRHAEQERNVAVDPDGKQEAEASGVPFPSSGSSGCCGCWKRISPASGSGLTLTIRAPRRTARWSAESIRGWLVPGFWPTTTTSWVWSKSSRVTDPFPRPSAFHRARPRSIRDTCCCSRAGCSSRTPRTKSW